jgi:hypothetical protein
MSLGVLDAWLDFNGDGDWNDANEHFLANQFLTESVLTNGQVTFRGLVVPSTAQVGDTYARFRLSPAGTQLPTGEIEGGEVEDYMVTIQSNPWQNPDNQYDVNDNGAVSPIDVLLIVNYLNDNPGSQTQPLPVPRPSDRPYLDVDGNGYAQPLDALLAINHLNALNLGEGEGEAAPSSRSHLDDILDSDENWSDIANDVEQTRSDVDAHDALFTNLGLS